MDFKKKTPRSVRELALFAMLGTLMFVFKIAMAGLPNIEPVSLLVVVHAVVFGRKALWSIYLYVLLEYLVWGFSFWTVAYLYIWLILYALARCFRHMKNPIGWAILSGTFGLCFGLLNAPVCLLFGDLSYALSWWISGIPYDLLHCAGNFAMAAVLFAPCRRILTVLCSRFQIAADVSDRR